MFDRVYREKIDFYLVPAVRAHDASGVGDSPAVEGSRERFTAEMPPDGDGSQRREQGHEGGATELAAFFSSRASSFISRSRAREVAVRLQYAVTVGTLVMGVD